MDTDTDTNVDFKSTLTALSMASAAGDDIAAVSCYCKSYEEAISMMKEVEQCHNVKFVIARSYSHYGSVSAVKNSSIDFDVKCLISDDAEKKKRLRWQGRKDSGCPMPFDGVPYVNSNFILFNCRRKKLENEITDFDSRTKYPQIHKQVKETNSAAIKEYIKFPDYAVDATGHCRDRRMSEAGSKLKRDAANGVDIRWERSFHLEIKTGKLPVPQPESDTPEPQPQKPKKKSRPSKKQLQMRCKDLANKLDETAQNVTQMTVLRNLKREMEELVKKYTQDVVPVKQKNGQHEHASMSIYQEPTYLYPVPQENGYVLPTLASIYQEHSYL